MKPENIELVIARNITGRLGCIFELLSVHSSSDLSFSSLVHSLSIKTSQIIAGVLRPGNNHSNRWYVAILKRVIRKIRDCYPDIEITIRADSGFSCPVFYRLADQLSWQLSATVDQ